MFLCYSILGSRKDARKMQGVFLLSDNIRPNGHRSFLGCRIVSDLINDVFLLGSRKDARKMQGVFFVVGWDPTVMDEGLILF